MYSLQIARLLTSLRPTMLPTCTFAGLDDVKRVRLRRAHLLEETHAGVSVLIICAWSCSEAFLWYSGNIINSSRRRRDGRCKTMASNNLQFKTNYAVSSKIEPFYKGGKVQINKDEKYILCTCGTRVNILEIATGQLTRSIEQDDQEDITSFALSPDDEILVTASRALLLKQWAWREGVCSRSWRAIHNTPVASMTFDPTSTLLATGGCDGTIKLWDVLKQYCTHNLKGSSGVVHLVQFHPDSRVLQLFSSSQDCGIRVWDLRSSQCVCVLQSHYSTVTGLAFSPDGSTLVSSGRDKICTVWNLKSRTVMRTVPVYEAVEAVVLLPEGGDFSEIGVKAEGLHFVTAGSKGVLRVWEAGSARCVFTQTPPVTTAPAGVVSGDDEEGCGLTHCLHLPDSARLATATRHNILSTTSCCSSQLFVGYNDEVLDVKFVGKGDSHIVVATNSPQLKVFDLATRSCQILYGHTGTVLSLDVFRKGTMFASCAKDTTVRVWRMDTLSGEVRCVAQGSGHANAVGSVSCSRLKESFVVTGSLDCTIKLSVRLTEKGHEKDVNSVAVSPNDKLVASGSQDRTVRVWSLAGLGLAGVCRGHRRGVWSVQFSPTDQVLASASADGAVKLWGLQDFSCLKTFEGHDASVLKVIFVSHGSQILTSGSDGLVKLWTIKTNECVRTLDAHEDKVWGLHASRKDDRAVTASADSSITLWQHLMQVIIRTAAAPESVPLVIQTHKRPVARTDPSCIASSRSVSCRLNKEMHSVATAFVCSSSPGRVCVRGGAGTEEEQAKQEDQILNNCNPPPTEIRQGQDGGEQLASTILKLRRDQKEAVLRYCAVWNTNARSCLDAQAVMEVLLKHIAPDDLLQYQGARNLLEALLPYTERHMQRIGRLLQASMFLDYMWQKMRVTGQSSVEAQGEDMDTVPAAPAPPLFIIDTQPTRRALARARKTRPRKKGRKTEREKRDRLACGSSAPPAHADQVTGGGGASGRPHLGPHSREIQNTPLNEQLIDPPNR
ncbi:hypothetical protein AAFF_G00212770 [Aldrovandia affinis]|uniref:U3 small nucleolar RNA-associated protein 13 C-terminal domain-containing protein n=1 Tax=Aldrovandia affinis TaxID=143900 RepID=A0AAD7RH13_9TELE|nr:hypothetical protein AAFF_G00212770 [Aldrovandia affinis]